MPRWLVHVLRTDDSYAALVLRVALAVVMFPHGAQKLLGWWGGPGLAGTFQMFEQAFGIPPALAALTIAAEFLGSLLLIAGLLGRVCALALGVNMLVALLLAHAGNGFFMNWSGQKAGEGFEFHLLAIGIAAALVLLGSGAWSLDRVLVRPRAAKVAIPDLSRERERGYAGAR